MTTHTVARRTLAAITPPAEAELHKYSCMTCRSRKVKCNKVINGCSNCNKAGISCVYSARQTRKTQQSPRQSRVRPLAPTGAAGDATVRPNRSSSITSENACESLESRKEDQVDDDDADIVDDILIPPEMRDPSFDSRQCDQGRLFVARGKSRFVDSRKAHQVRDPCPVPMCVFNEEPCFLSLTY